MFLREKIKLFASETRSHWIEPAWITIFCENPRVFPDRDAKNVTKTGPRLWRRKLKVQRAWPWNPSAKWPPALWRLAAEVFLVETKGDHMIPRLYMGYSWIFPVRSGGFFRHLLSGIYFIKFFSIQKPLVFDVLCKHFRENQLTKGTRWGLSFAFLIEKNSTWRYKN